MLHSDVLTVPSEFLAAATRENFTLPEETPIEVIPNFVDTEHWKPMPRRWGAIAALVDREPAPVLAHSSNFRAVKRVDDVVRVFARVRAHRPAYLILFGDGPERAPVERLVVELGVAADVRFLGAQKDYAATLAQAQLFLMPSASESFGLAALEAQSAGLPVIATRVGGVPEVIADGETGLLSPLGAVDEMAANALALLDDPTRLKRMSEAARARALEHYRMEPMIDRYEAAYRRVLGT